MAAIYDASGRLLRRAIGFIGGFTTDKPVCRALVSAVSYTVLQPEDEDDPPADDSKTACGSTDNN